ncbi:MAG: hypothetical protein H6834_18440 [Planctomycetes bacterium]|nr:hypothetical protein [Planctomycetota bacterium]
MPSHVADPFGTVAHGAHADPQVATSVSETQAPAQGWNPESHSKPQVPPAQVAVPKATIGHTVVQEPQWFTSESPSTQDRSHLIGVMLEQPVAHPYAPELSIVQTGVGPVQATPQPPQSSSVVVTVSHPS